MPPFAATKRPARALTAPVNAPLMWPKSSVSSSVSGIAAQFTGTKAWPRRDEPRWAPRAKSSLPVPVSPVIRMLQSVAAARGQHLDRIEHFGRLRR